MKRFNDFQIQLTPKGFEGEKVKITKLFDKEIVVHKFTIEPSKVYTEGTGLCLCLQLTFNSEKRILFTSASKLIEAIKQVPEDGFPFTTIIIDDNDAYRFT